jgi:hypothetical protein
MKKPYTIVAKWQEAANRQDIERLLALSDLDIEVVGPRGGGRGHQLLRDWMGRAGLSLTTLRAFARDDIVVLAQHGVWRSAETGEVIGEQDLASLFRVGGGRVVRFARYDGLDEALAAAGLTDADAIV